MSRGSSLRGSTFLGVGTGSLVQCFGFSKFFAASDFILVMTDEMRVLALSFKSS